jgi:NADH dehydrogenase (ubiquinone) 1 beta subcomplex subunit 10
MSSTAIPPTIEDYRRKYPFPVDSSLANMFLGTLKAREEHVRESWIKAMEARIVRGELQKCYRGEGVNQLQNCKELAERYASMIRENKVCRFFGVWSICWRVSLMSVDQGVHGH